MDADDLDDCMDGEGKYAIMHEADSNASLYYFGNNEDEDGALKTGATTVSLNGDTYSFYFNKSGGAESKGKGLTGIDDGKYIYKFGMKIKADSDDKYKVVYANGDTGSDNITVEEIDSSALRTLADNAGQNKDEDSVKFFGTLGSDYYLVNTSGSIVKNKTAAKDGDDWYFYVDDKNVKMYTNNKTLTVDSGAAALTDAAGNVLKDAWDTDATITNKDGAPSLSEIMDR